MIDRAGGVAALGVAGGTSRRVGWDEIARSEPDLVVAAPCGFDMQESADLARELVAGGRLPVRTPVWAVDANGLFTRPGPRLVDGVEALAAILHPDVLGLPDPQHAAQLR